MWGFFFLKKIIKKVKTYKLNYKDSDGKILLTIDTQSNNLEEVIKQSKTLVEFCREKSVTSIEIKK